MFLRILGDSLLRRKRRKAIVLAAIALGTAAAAALGDIALDVGDKMNRELRSFGANLVVVPAGGGSPVVVGGEDVSGLRVPAYLDAAEMVKIKDNFWKNNILEFAPVFDTPAQVAGRTVLLRGAWFERRVPIESGPGEEPVVTGLIRLNPSWTVEGRWPHETAVPQGADRASMGSDRPEALVGRRLAESLGVRPGGRIEAEVAGRTKALAVSGIVTTGGEEEDGVVLPIEAAWSLAGVTDRVSRVYLRALTTPESAVYERLGRSPKDLPPAEFERWTCTPFPSSIAYELDRSVPGAEARVIRRVADTEGTILRRISGLMVLIALLAAASSALTVTSALTTSVLERRSEIGILKALGAGAPRVVGLFMAEAAILGLLGGLLGAGAGALLARFISTSVFGSPVAIRPLSIPLAVAVALVITLAGCLVPARRIMAFRPFQVLRGL
jgi:putative ABC transport system permease protein